MSVPALRRQAADALEQRRYAAAPAALLVVLLLLAAVQGTNLYSSTGVAGAVASAAPLILATLAITPVAIAGQGGVDLSIGPLMAFINVTTVHWLVANGVTSPVLVIGFAVGMGMLFGAVNGLLIGLLRVQPVIVTLSGFLVLSGLNLVILPQPGGTVPDWMASWGTSTAILSPLAGLVLAALVVWWAIGRTSLFHNIRLAGANERTAYASGVPLLAVRVGAHVVGGFFGGLAGLSYAALISSADPTQGSSYTLFAVTALVLGGVSLGGGLGGATGAVLGAVDIFMIGYVLATFDFGASASFVVQLAYGAVLVVTLAAGSVVAAGRSRRRRATARQGRTA
jgi:ribose transport system permease protein